jgi:hypothetical protein
MIAGNVFRNAFLMTGSFGIHGPGRWPMTCWECARSGARMVSLMPENVAAISLLGLAEIYRQNNQMREALRALSETLEGGCWPESAAAMQVMIRRALGGGIANRPPRPSDDKGANLPVFPLEPAREALQGRREVFPEQRVRLVEKGTHPQANFSMLGGTAHAGAVRQGSR